MSDEGGEEVKQVVAVGLWAVAFILTLGVLVECHMAVPLPPTKSGRDWAHAVSSVGRSPSLNCCIATIVDASHGAAAVALAHSLRGVGRYRFFAMLDGVEVAADSILREVFTPIDISSVPAMRELLFWSELPADCQPVVALALPGVFSSLDAIDDICAATPFAAVSRTGDVVYFDDALMVLDPHQPLSNLTQPWPSFQKYSGQMLIDWRPLNPDLSVAWVNNDYLDFWLGFGVPGFIHFPDSLLEGVVRGDPMPPPPPDKETGGAPQFYRLIGEIVSRAVSAEPAAFAAMKGTARWRHHA